MNSKTLVKIEDRQLASTTQQSSISCVTYPSLRIKNLFDEFAGIYGYRWSSVISDPAVLKITIKRWHDATKDLTDKQVEKALQKCSLTDEFISIHSFRLAALELIPADRAWEVRESDRLAKQIWDEFITWDKIHKPERELREGFISKYENLVAKLLLGGNNAVL